MMAALGLALPLKVPFGLFTDSVLLEPALRGDLLLPISCIALLAGSNWMATPGCIVLGAICHYTAHESSCQCSTHRMARLELDPRPTVLAYGMQISGAS